MKFITLTNSNLIRVMVDDGDHEWLSRRRWQLNKANGAVQRCQRIQGANTTILLARQIMGEPKGKVVDHRNHDKLDNAKQNLRVATPSQNGGNRIKQRAQSLSKFKGVSRFAGKWTAHITLNGKKRQLGAFGSEVDAARAYNRAAESAFSEFAYKNEVVD